MKKYFIPLMALVILTISLVLYYGNLYLQKRVEDTSTKYAIVIMGFVIWFLSVVGIMNLISTHKNQTKHEVKK